LKNSNGVPLQPAVGFRAVPGVVERGVAAAAVAPVEAAGRRAGGGGRRVPRGPRPERPRVDAEGPVLWQGRDRRRDVHVVRRDGAGLEMCKLSNSPAIGLYLRPVEGNFFLELSWVGADSICLKVNDVRAD